MTHYSASLSIRITLLQLVIFAAVLWCVFGEPLSDVAGLFFRSGPAPWEEIDLIYFPDRNSPSASEVTPDISSLDECRTRAFHLALQHDDPDMERGGYECRTTSARLFGSQRTYRLSLK